MKLWVDAQISPAIARWMQETLAVEAFSVQSLGLRDATDAEIFEAARAASATVMTKDSDFVRLLERFGPPPQVVWLTCGNTSNARLRDMLLRVWPTARAIVDGGEPLVEISDAP